MPLDIPVKVFGKKILRCPHYTFETAKEQQQQQQKHIQSNGEWPAHSLTKNSEPEKGTF
ncbi:hypothetical protein GQX74_001733 [Glossina fuscipes]|nr:hypothetical protein GQX74_001733 [Glossina fuscipes]